MITAVQSGASMRTVPRGRRCWFWSISMIGARHTGIRTDGCTPTLKQAKVELQANWRKWLVSARLEQPTPND
jgi:hypothetical protein